MKQNIYLTKDKLDESEAVAVRATLPSGGGVGVVTTALMTDYTRENDHNKVAAVGLGLAEILIEQAMREQAIISKMTQAVQDGDKDRVFQLAEELTCVMSDIK
ncbi:MAG: hypothetical protein WCG36_08700 [bacterium]